MNFITDGYIAIWTENEKSKTFLQVERFGVKVSDEKRDFLWQKFLEMKSVKMGESRLKLEKGAKTVKIGKVFADATYIRKAKTFFSDKITVEVVGETTLRFSDENTTIILAGLLPKNVKSYSELEFEKTPKKTQVSTEEMRTFAEWKNAGFIVKRGEKATVKQEKTAKPHKITDKKTGNYEIRTFCKKIYLFSAQQVKAI